MALASHSPHSLGTLRFASGTQDLSAYANGCVVSRLCFGLPVSWSIFSLHPALRYGYKDSEWLLRAILPIPACLVCFAVNHGFYPLA